MSEKRQRRVRSAWYACYLAALMLLASAVNPAPVEAQTYCYGNGTSNCSMMLSPCPWNCYVQQYTEDFAVTDGCPSGMCRRGFCMSVSWDGSIGCLVCQVDFFTVCLCCGEA